MLRVTQHDLLFNMLSVTRIAANEPTTKAARLLTARVFLQVDSRLARHLVLRGGSVGLFLFRYHKQILCREVCLTQRSTKKPLLECLRDWLTERDVDEDDLALDSAYKILQRHIWSVGENHFLEKTEKIAQKPEQKNSSLSYGRSGLERLALPVQKGTLDPRAEEVSGKLYRLVSACLRFEYRNAAKRLQIFTYRALFGYSVRETAHLLDLPTTTVHDGFAAIRRWMAADPTFREAITRFSALPD